jgi:hypothetical protein
VGQVQALVLAHVLEGHRVNPSEWARAAGIVAPHLRRLSEDGASHALSLLPKLAARAKPRNWRGSNDGWLIQQAKREAFRHDWKEQRRGLKMRNGSTGFTFLSVDDKVHDWNEEETTLGDTLFGDDSPEAWFEAYEFVGAVHEKKINRLIHKVFGA